MSLISLAVTLIVVGVLLWLVNAYSVSWLSPKIEVRILFQLPFQLICQGVSRA